MSRFGLPPSPLSSVTSFMDGPEEGEREPDGEREKEQSHTADRPTGDDGGVDVREIIRHINAPATQLQAARTQGDRQNWWSSDVDIQLCLFGDRATP